MYGYKFLQCVCFYVSVLANFYTAQTRINRLLMAACKVWPIWRRLLVRTGEFPFACIEVTVTAAIQSFGLGTSIKPGFH